MVKEKRVICRYKDKYREECNKNFECIVKAVMWP